MYRGQQVPTIRQQHALFPFGLVGRKESDWSDLNLIVE